MGKKNSAERLQDAITDIRDEYIIEAADTSDIENHVGSHEYASESINKSNGVDIFPVPEKDGGASNGWNRRTKRIRIGRFMPVAAACAAIATISAIGVGMLSDRDLSTASYSVEARPGSTSSYDGGMSGDSAKGTYGAKEADKEVSYEVAEEAMAISPSAGMAGMAVDRTGDGAMFSPAHGINSSDVVAEGAEAVAEVIIPDGEVPDGPIVMEPVELSQATPFTLTAGLWNDNSNWPFFTNLGNSGTISFPSYGLDPRSRIEVVVTDEEGDALWGETVKLLDENGECIWTAKTDKDGRAYLFSKDGEVPFEVAVNGDTVPVADIDYEETEGTGTDEDGEEPAPGQGRGGSAMVSRSEIHVVTGRTADISGLQVMFVIDTTGSMSDEIAYLQKDFSSIAGEVGSDVSWSVNFYRDRGDEYVTKCFDFTTDVEHVQSLINAEYAQGGGDNPEAVSQILEETITENDGWSGDASKLLFLVFDAPPHDDEEVYKVHEAVKSAAEKGIRIVPVVASNAERSTEVFGRALSIMTGADYVFLTDDSGVGYSHLEPIIGDYEVELLHDIIVRLINDAKTGN